MPKAAAISGRRRTQGSSSEATPELRSDFSERSNRRQPSGMTPPRPSTAISISAAAIAAATAGGLRRTNPADIANKMRRSQILQRQAAEIRHLKLKARLAIKKAEEQNPALKEERLATNVPRTLENTRELDVTIVDPEMDDEVMQDEETDEFAKYFVHGLTPKVLVTTCRRADKDTIVFAKEFRSIIPAAHYVKRGQQFTIQRIVEIANKREYTDLVIVSEDKGEPNAITFMHLPDGPTAHFKLSSIKLNKEIRGHGRVGPHKPELILNNFNTRLGHTIGRMFAALFPHVPEFKGRQVATFHNQRDFIFFRRHRYIFNEEKECVLQELGPRFTLKLKWLQKGIYDLRNGEYEWMHKPELDTSRRRFFL
ncbi:anticodon-binding protein [Zopfochytrium polystomum]|nr:anticodon-binding protein [Zopfochytrium polystomum]